MPLILVLGRHWQKNLCELEASLVYRVSSRVSKAIERVIVLKNKNKQTKRTLIQLLGKLARWLSR